MYQYQELTLFPFSFFLGCVAAMPVV